TGRQAGARQAFDLPMNDDVLHAPRRRDARGPDRGLVSPIRRTVIACATHPLPVIFIAALLCAAALHYAMSHFAIDTDAAKLISADVPWRQRELAFAKAFPQRVDLIAVVVDGVTPEQAESATAKLAHRLQGTHDLFRAVWRPDGGTFFEREGLLFESTGDIEQTTQRLIAAQPLLGTLAADPSLRGLMDALSLMAMGATRDPAAPDALAKPLDALANAFAGIAAGQAPAF